MGTLVNPINPDTFAWVGVPQVINACDGRYKKARKIRVSSNTNLLPRGGREGEITV